MGQRKYSKSQWGIAPQTFGFCSLIPYQPATEESNLRPSDSGSDSLPLSYRDSMVSEAGHYEVHNACAMYILLGLWGLRIFSLSNTCDKTKNIFLYIALPCKLKILSYSIYKHGAFWLILAVYRVHVIYELCNGPCSP